MIICYDVGMSIPRWRPQFSLARLLVAWAWLCLSLALTRLAWNATDSGLAFFVAYLAAMSASATIGSLFLGAKGHDEVADAIAGAGLGVSVYSVLCVLVVVGASLW